MVGRQGPGIQVASLWWGQRYLWGTDVPPTQLPPQPGSRGFLWSDGKVRVFRLPVCGGGKGICGGRMNPQHDCHHSLVVGYSYGRMVRSESVRGVVPGDVKEA